MPFIDKNPTPEWRLQTSQRKGGLYYQAVISTGTGKDRKRRCVTLGFLTPEEAQAALTALTAAKAPLLAKDVSDDGVRAWASEVAGEAIVTEMVAHQARANGDYGRMPLSVFVRDVFMPVRNTEVSKGTQKNEATQWRKINPVIGSVPVRKVDGVVIERLMAHYAANTAPTRRRMVIAIRAVLNYAVAIGVIKELPRMRPIKGGMARVKPRPVALSASEVAAILDQATSPTQRALWAYAVGQGLRPTEANRLDWADVDWSAGMILVRGTKTEKSLRRVPMTPATKAELEPYWLSLGKPSTGWAFPNRYPGQDPAIKWNRPFKKAAKKAGVEKAVNAYTCRHTFATACAMQGVPMPATREMLGHSAHSRVLEEVYSNPDAGMLANAVKGLTKLGG